MLRTSLLFMFVTASAAVLGWPGAACAQSPQQPRAELTPIEVAAGVSFKRTGAVAGLDQRWTGPALSVGLDVKVTSNLAVAAQGETDFQGAQTLLAGMQMSTGFYYGNNRDPVPGRFFGRMLFGGASGAGYSGMRAATQLAGGADILLSRSKGVGLRWEAGYEFLFGDVPHHANGRVAIGLLFGPHLRRS
jgi:hypothetical protein